MTHTQDALLVEHWPWVLRTARRLAARLHPSARDGAESDALLGALQAARSWRPEGGAGYRLHAYARMRGAVLDHARAALGGRRRHPPPRVVPLSGTLACPAAPRPAVETEDSVRRLLTLLPGRAALAARLVLVDGLRQCEAARRMGVHSSRVSTLLREARAWAATLPASLTEGTP